MWTESERAMRKQGIHRLSQPDEARAQEKRASPGLMSFVQSGSWDIFLSRKTAYWFISLPAHCCFPPGQTDLHTPDKNNNTYL